MNRHEIDARLNALHQMLRDYDYIGVKIATGRATIKEYTDQIAQMKSWAAEVNDLELLLSGTQGYVEDEEAEETKVEAEDFDKDEYAENGEEIEEEV